MSDIRFRWLAVIGLVAGAVGWLVNWWATRNGLPAPSLHLSSLITVLVITGITLIFGRKVLVWRNGSRKKALNPILALRTLILAQACAYAGALSLGWHAGIFVDQLSLVGVRSASGPLWGSLALMAGGIGMIVVGLVVESFCRLPPGGDDAAGPVRKSRDEGEYA